MGINNYIIKLKEKLWKAKHFGGQEGIQFQAFNGPRNGLANAKGGKVGAVDLTKFKRMDVISTSFDRDVNIDRESTLRDM